MTIFFIGDSFIEYGDWQARFQGHRVINLGVSGETVEELLDRVHEITRIKETPGIIFLMSGANNVFMEEMGFFPSYRQIIKQLTSAYPDARIYLHSLPPTLFDPEIHESIMRVNATLRTIAEGEDIGFINIYDLFVNENGMVRTECFLPDEVHLSDEGYRQWAGGLEGIVNGP